MVALGPGERGKESAEETQHGCAADSAGEGASTLAVAMAAPQRTAALRKEPCCRLKAAASCD